MRKITFLAAIWLLVTYQSASAETVYYCFTKHEAKVIYDHFTHYHGDQRFMILVDGDSVAMKTDERPLKGLKTFTIFDHKDDRSWSASGGRNQTMHLAFNYPNVYFTKIGPIKAHMFYATCEDF